MAFPSLTPWYSDHLAGWDSPPTGQSGVEGTEAGQAFHILHGNGFCARVLEPVAQRIHNSYPDSQWLFTDLPGHGLTSTSKDTQPVITEPDWNRMAEQVAASVRRRSSEPVVGIGHSLGGVVTLLAAAQYPTLFSRLILIDPVIYSTEVLAFQAIMKTTGLWQKRAFIRRVQARQAHWPDCETAMASLRRKGLYQNWSDDALMAFVSHGMKHHADNSLHLACAPQTEAAIFASRPRRLWPSVRQLHCPVDILVADTSYPFIRRAVKRAERLNPRVRGTMVSGSHCVAMENPEIIAAEIQRLLAE